MSEYVFSTNAPKRPFVKVLTSLRFFAAFCIFLLHARNHGFEFFESIYLLDLSKSVSFFFVLSGFVLTLSYHRRPLSLPRFYLQRFVRIWPIHVLSIFFVILLLPEGLYLPSSNFDDISFFSILATHLLLIQSLFPIPAFFFGLNAVSWSISVEAFFYLLFPFLAKLRCSSLYLIYISLLAFTILTAFSLRVFEIPSFGSNTLYEPVYQGFLYINPISRLPEFIVGILFSRLYLSSPFASLLLNIETSIPQPLYCFPFLLLMFFSLTIGFMPPFNFGDLRLLVVLNQFSSSLSFGIFILLASSFKSSIIKFLENSTFLFLGKISFSFYLFHQPIMIKAAQGGGLSILGINILPSNIFIILAWSLALSSIFCFGFESLIVKQARKLLR